MLGGELAHQRGDVAAVVLRRRRRRGCGRGLRRSRGDAWVGAGAGAGAGAGCRSSRCRSSLCGRSRCRSSAVRAQRPAPRVPVRARVPGPPRGQERPEPRALQPKGVPEPITASWAPTSTVSSSATLISSSVPATGEGISVSTLSVETSSSGSSTATASPTDLSQRVTVPSVTDSPSAGRVTGVPSPPPPPEAAAGAAGASCGLRLGSCLRGGRRSPAPAAARAPAVGSGSLLLGRAGAACSSAAGAARTPTRVPRPPRR